jgi:MoaA/NifB/PqqE/SkfB family radical SAM enzyme
VGLLEQKFEHNLKLQKKEYSNGDTNLKSIPTRMSIIFGNRCNLRCKMCGNRGLYTRLKVKNTTKLSEKNLDKIISYFPFLEVLALSGGEPLLYDELKRVVSIAEDYPKLSLKIITNGNLINDFWINKFCGLPFTNISISLDAATEKTYNQIRVRGDFKNVLRSIEKINNSKLGKEPELALNFVVMRRNIHEMEKFVELAHEYNVSKILFQPIQNQRKLFYSMESVTNSDIVCSKLLKLSERVRDLAGQYGIKIVNRIPSFILQDKPEFFFNYFKINKNDLNNNGNFRCPKMWRKVDISPGFVNICPYGVSTDYAPIQYYNVNNEMLNGFWNNDAFVQARQRMIEHRYDDVCKVSCLKLFEYKTKGVL